MGSFQDFTDMVGGAVSDDNFKKSMALAGNGPDQSSYQIGGMGDFTNRMGDLYGRAGQGAPDLTGATQGAVANQQALQQYLQRVGMGQGTTAADAMFQNATAQNARQAQSAAVSAGGMNPALAMRQILGAQSAGMGSLAGQSAQQKLQEQMGAAQAAGQNNQALYNMQFQNQQQQFQNNQAQIQQQSSLAQNIFQANQAQTAYNVQYQQNKQAFNQWQATQNLQQQQAHAQALSKFIQMGVQLAGSAAGMATGVGAAGQLAGLAGNIAGGAMQSAFTGGGQYKDPYSNDDGSMMGVGTGTFGGGQ